MRKVLAVFMLTSLFCAPFAGCTNMSKTQQGVLSGGVIGAAGGAGIAAISGGSVGVGALIGGGVGALAGGIIGHNK